MNNMVIVFDHLILANNKKPKFLESKYDSLNLINPYYPKYYRVY